VRAGVGVAFRRWAIGWLLVAVLAIGLLVYALATNAPPRRPLQW